MWLVLLMFYSLFLSYLENVNWIVCVWVCERETEEEKERKDYNNDYDDMLKRKYKVIICEIKNMYI